MPKPNTDPTAKPTKTQQLDPTLMSVADAADRLGVTSDAIRMRLKRGALTGEKRGGRLFVRLPDPTSNPTTDQTETQRPPNGDLLAVIASKDAALDHAEREIDWLRDQLSERSRELATERERADVLSRIALDRIESLTAGNVSDSSQAHENGLSGAIAKGLDDASLSTPATPSKRAGWWSRIFGR